MGHNIDQHVQYDIKLERIHPFCTWSEHHWDILLVQIYLTYMNLVVQGLLPFSLVVWLNTRTYQQIKHLNSLPLAVMPGPGLTAGLEAVSGKLKEVRVMVRRDHADSLPSPRSVTRRSAWPSRGCSWCATACAGSPTSGSCSRPAPARSVQITELYQPMLGVLSTLRGWDDAEMMLKGKLSWITTSCYIIKL